MRRKLAAPAAALAAVLAAVLAALLLAWQGLLPGAGERLTILMYHHVVPVGERVNGMTVTAQRLREDLEWLKTHGYTTLLPRELASGAPLPDRCVLITFDDGYASNYAYAYPLLRELDMKAAIAVVGRVVDSGDSQYLTWDMCREMSGSGLVEIGSHSYDLHNLDERGGGFAPDAPNGVQRLPGETRAEFGARVLSDLEKSAAQLEAELGAPVTYLAYPYGAGEPWAEDFVRQRFAVSVTTRDAAADPSGGTYNLPRKAVTMDRTAADCFGFWDYLKEIKHSIFDW